MIDPNAIITIEEIVAAPMFGMLEQWSTMEPPDEELAPPADPERLLEVIAALTQHPAVAAVRSALAAGDPHADTTVRLLQEYSRRAAGSLVERCAQLRDGAQWEQLRREAGLGVGLAASTGAVREEIALLQYFALASRRRDDLDGTIAGYGRALQRMRAVAPDRHTMAIVADNLGNALVDAGSFDEALAHYDFALTCEDDPRGRTTIRMNRAKALSQLGELHSAALTMREAIKEYEGGDPIDLGLALDTHAVTLAELGETDEAYALLSRAQSLLSAAPPRERAGNALSRAAVQGWRGEVGAAAAAFAEARAVFEEEATQSIKVEHYREGFRQARVREDPPQHVAEPFIAALKARDRGDRVAAVTLFREAAAAASELGDTAFALRMHANVTAMLADDRVVDQAVAVGRQTIGAAAAAGLARPELMALATLASLAMGGADVPFAGGALGTLCRARVLMRVHAEIVAGEGVTGDEAAFETYDLGTIDLQLGKLALRYHARDAAVADFRSALEKGRAGGAFEVVNRLAALLDVSGTEPIAAELEALMGTSELNPRTRIAGHRALAAYREGSDSAAAIRHLRAAEAALDAWRASVAPGPDRAALGAISPRLHDTLARLLREAGDETAAFEALQGGKGRDLVDRLAARSQGDDAPASVTEVVEWLAQLGGEAPTALVDIAGEPGGITAYVVTAGGVRALHEPGPPARSPEGGDVREREARVVEHCQTDPVLGALVAAVDDAVGEGTRILLVPDPAMRNLPLHLCPVAGAPWGERAAIGTLGAATALRFAPARRAATGRSLVAGDSDGSLPYAHAESLAVAAILGTKALVGPECTRAAIAGALEASALDVVHLAVHGRGDVRHGGRASLLLADGEGGASWVAFEELAQLAWRAELVVFSGCSTAVAGARHGFELLDVASAAANAGAAAVVACLWPVGDEAASVCMQAFHAALADGRRSGPVDLRVALDHGRAELRRFLDERSGPDQQRRDGRREVAPDVAPPAVLDPALEWGPFILIGDPIVGN